MKLIEALNAIDAMEYSDYTQAEKIRWLSELDMTVKREILDTHEGSEAYRDFTGYTVQTDVNTELLVPHPYDRMYLHWLEARVSYANREIDPYNNAMTTFNSVYADFFNWYNRNHMAYGKSVKWM